MLKHAYLIMAHEYTLVLERLVQLLDHENNGIYIHIDTKAPDAVKRKVKALQQLAKQAEVFIFSRYKVFWGTNSIVKVQKYLLTNSVRGV